MPNPLSEKNRTYATVWITASLLELVFTTGVVNTGLDALAFGSLFTWAWLELFQGVNYFRRALGLGVLIGVIASRTLGIDVLGSFAL
ncbi:hypothetical protein [Scytonema sp. HK-05]|uniref:hypothetical protein n=1 Tax=Scytonema sp. HK-05 TaxID=1137095 RepID=UPI000935B9F5|nr:hypothetical protein [Scytonema sp. HK-05]OKH58381.1 hypothetical protein NIES2130_15025 [Scytonema sp. HK-05]